jgi:hypothetical protein
LTMVMAKDDVRVGFRDGWNSSRIEGVAAALPVLFWMLIIENSSVSRCWCFLQERRRCHAGSMKEEESFVKVTGRGFFFFLERKIPRTLWRFAHFRVVQVPFVWFQDDLDPQLHSKLLLFILSITLISTLLTTATFKLGSCARLVRLSLSLDHTRRASNPFDLVMGSWMRLAPLWWCSSISTYWL